jgi:hypothetical protein
MSPMTQMEEKSTEEEVNWEMKLGMAGMMFPVRT